jgi:hypothetical protein
MEESSIFNQASEISNPKKEKANISEVLNEYYKLKSKYEDNFHDKYIKPILRSEGKSKREKRLEYQKLPKPECINCKRNVGSIFTIKKDSQEYSRTFIAKCGNLDDPCPLNIVFDYTGRDELDKEILKHNNDIKEIKNKIIFDKNNMMFGYIDQTKAVEIFNTDTTELKEISEAAGFIMEINIQLNDNPVKKNLIKTNEDKLGIDYLVPFKSMIKEFEQTGKTEILNKAVKFYVDEMAPLAKTITNLKYEVSYVDFLEKKDNEDPTEKGDLYILVQKKNSIYNLEYTLYGNDDIKSFTKGTKDFGSKSKTKKNLEQIHKKTRKLRPDLDFVEEEDTQDEEQYEGPDEGQDEGPDEGQDYKPINLRKKLILQNATEALEESKRSEPELQQNLIEQEDGAITPYINSDGSVTWSTDEGQINMKYQNIWDALTPEYKAALIQDEGWMKKTIDHFVAYNILRLENKVPYISNREFVHPDGLLLPPQKINDTDYDYGNSIYNKLLNGDRNPIWLSFLPRTNRPGSDILHENYSNQYSGYLNAIASYLGHKIKFTKY